VFELDRIRELILSDSQWTGQIPVFVGLLPNLELLDLSNNVLEGRIPPELWRLPRLKYVLLNDNEFSGEVPESIQSAEYLQVMTLYNNNLYGDLTPVCKSSHFNLLAIDCDTGLTCEKTCCPTCCSEDDEECYTGVIEEFLHYNEGMWEFNYTRPAYDFDPMVLAEDSLFQVIQDSP
jgi:Leucine rich repeat